MNYDQGKCKVLSDEEIGNSQPLSLPSSNEAHNEVCDGGFDRTTFIRRPPKGTGQHGQFRSIEEIDPKYRGVFTYPFFNLVQSTVIEDALYSDKSLVVCAPTGSGKTVVFEMAIVQLLMELEDKHYEEDFKIIYMAPVKALCTEKLSEWYPKFTKLGLMCIEVTGDTDVDFSQLSPYRLIITTPEKWDMLTRRWRDHKGLVELIKLFLIDEVHILNDEVRGPVLEAVVSRMKTVESSAQSSYRMEQIQHKLQGAKESKRASYPRIRFVAVSATVGNPEDVAAWLGTPEKPAVFHKFGDECRPVKLKRIVEGYPCPPGTSIFKFDIILNYKLWPIIQKYNNGKPTLIFCNTRKGVLLTAETLSRELTINFNTEQKAKLTAVASTIKNKKLQSLVLSGIGCHHAGMLFEERTNIERAFKNRDLPILITTTTLAMGVNLPAHLVIVKNTQQYVNGAYQEYSISTVLQMVGRAGRPQFDTEATAVIMTRLADKARYQALVGGTEPLQSYLHKRLPENLNSEAALGTVGDVSQCVQWLRSTFLFIRAARDPRRYLGLSQNSPQHLITKKIEELCVIAMNGLASHGLITKPNEASCIESTEAGRLMSIYYLDLETMKLIMKIEGTESLERLLWLICESHELADMHLRVDERRCLNALNRNNAATTIRFPMKGKITSRQMKLNCVIQATLGCLPIPDPSLAQEATKIMRTADRVCKCVVAYVTRPNLISQQPKFYSAVINTLTLAKCLTARLWEVSPYVSKQLKGIGPTFSTLLAAAGKISFMLLEESHPRDLERIMNKGPPAGNVLRKQISLLPKYQLTISPVDVRTIVVELLLLNQSYLAVNIESLTAGDNHKSYIVVGDSSNHILLMTSFKDKDLISVYDGIIKHEIKRKHDFEHKVFAHCISSSFVGIDVQEEYLFTNLDNLFVSNVHPISCSELLTNKPTKQTCITDTYKERKRKNNNEVDITHSKEKRKRDNAIIEKIKSLKESFGINTKKQKPVLDKTEKEPDNIFNKEVKNPTILNNSTKKNIDPTHPVLKSYSLNEFNEDIDYNEFIDNEKIDTILNEIENEITEVTQNTTNPIEQKKAHISTSSSVKNNLSSTLTNNLKKPLIKNTQNIEISFNKLYRKGKSRDVINKHKKYNFREPLIRNSDFSDDDQEKLKINGFSEAIKCHIDQYLQKTKAESTFSKSNIETLLEDTVSITNTYTALPKSDHSETKVENEIKESEMINPKKCIEEKYKEKSISNESIKLNLENSAIENIGLENIKEFENKDVPSNIKTCNSQIFNITDTLPKTDKNSIAVHNDTNKIIDRNILSTGIGTGESNDKECVYSDNHTIIHLDSEDNKLKACKGIVPVANIDNDALNFKNTTALKSRSSHVSSSFIDSLCKEVTTDQFLPEDLGSEETSYQYKFNKQKEYVRNFKSSKIKTDIFTKDSIKIIRKLKIDLNVAEIIAFEETDLQDKTNLNENTDQIELNESIEQLYGSSQYNEQKFCEPVVTNIAKSNSMTSNQLPTCIVDEPKYKNTVFSKQEDSSKIIQNDIKVNNVCFEDEGANKFQNTNFGNTNTISLTPTSVVLNNSQHGIYESTSESKADKLRNILQKYSEIFGKDCQKPTSSNHSSTNLINNLSKSTKTKPDRPFNITEIDRIEAPLPKCLIVDKPLHINFNHLNVEKSPAEDKPRDNNTHQLHQYNTVAKLGDFFEDICTNDCEMLNVSNENLELCRDSKIDGSLFDPQTLLKCVVNSCDDEIVPPPPQFCDVTDYSPNYGCISEIEPYPIPNYDIDLPNNNYNQCANFQDFSNVKYDDIYNDSIFDDKVESELTPSKEIETWNVSQENSLEYNLNPVKSLTVMHTNMTDDILNSTLSRRVKLSKFKFNLKNKLKIRK